MVRLRCWAVINDRLRGLTAEDHARRSPAPAHQHQRTKAPKAAPRHPGTSARPTPTPGTLPRGAGAFVSLRRERMLASGPDGPALREERRPQPVRAVPAQVQLAVPLDAVDRSDRRPAPVTHLVHLRSPSLDGSCHSGRRRSGTGFPGQPFVRHILRRPKTRRWSGPG